jgi:crotonobetainyl-CoA:carnitine CoA-transferase CaiB-like acyl-CoA transferase
MEGFRVLEVAQFTFVPAAGAILADWGADVIKVEHPSAVTLNVAFSTWVASSSTRIGIR